MKRALSTTAKLALSALVLFFVARQFQQHWVEIKTYQWQVDPVPAVASLVLGVLAMYLQAGLWRPIMRSLGYEISGVTAFRVLYLASLGRYVPGKVWQLFGVLYLTRKEGIATEQAGASFVLMQMFSLPASALVFLVTAQFESGLLVDQVALMGPKSGWTLALIIFLVSAYIVLWPQKTIDGANWLLGKLKRPGIEISLGRFTALKVFLGFCIAWVAYGLAFWLLIQSVTSGDKIGPVASVGTFVLAYQIGYVALFAPSGLGPRELTMQLLLVPFLGPITPAIVIVARLWSVILDVSAAIIALVLRSRSRRLPDN